MEQRPSKPRAAASRPARRANWTTRDSGPSRSCPRGAFSGFRVCSTGLHNPPRNTPKLLVLHVGGEHGSQATPRIPSISRNFVTRLLPAGSRAAALLLIVREVVAQLG